jgi:hypothetical protein
MATEVRFRRGTAADHSGFTGAPGEITVDTTKKTARVHDGSTAGGSVLATEAYVDESFGQSEFVLPRSVSWDQGTDTYSGNPGVIDTHLKMRRCVMDGNGRVLNYLDPANSAYNEDGSTSDLSAPGTQVMVEIPAFWVKTNIAGSTRTWSVSAVPRSGYSLHPAFVAGGETLDHIYVGAYIASVYSQSEGAYIDGLNLDNNASRVSLSDDHLASVSGRYPMVGLTRSQFRDLAGNFGDGRWHLEDFWCVQAVQLLYLIEYGNFDSQAMLGSGNDSRSYSGSSDSQADSPHESAGRADAIGNESGSGPAWVSYRGIEHVHGNCWRWVDGFNLNDRQSFICDDPSQYADDTQAGYVALGRPLPTASSDQIRTLQDEPHVLLPDEVGGGASTSSFVAGTLWTNSGWRVARVGGIAGSGSLVSVFSWSLSGDSGDRSRYRGGRVARRARPS